MYGNYIDYEISGFYDNGGIYDITLAFKKENHYNDFKKKIENKKEFIKDFFDEDLRITLSSNNVKNSFNFLKRNCINLKLQTL